MNRRTPEPTIRWTFAFPGLTKSSESSIGFHPRKGQNIKTVGAKYRPRTKNAGAKEVCMVGVSLPLTALFKAMAISGLMWVAIGVQAAIWLN